MDASARAELNAIKSELRSIITELENISSGLRREFKGIGADVCAKRIDDAVSNYEAAYRKLCNI